VRCADEVWLAIEDAEKYGYGSLQEGRIGLALAEELYSIAKLGSGAAFHLEIFQNDG